jgi:hypothetical protein
VTKQAREHLIPSAELARSAARPAGKPEIGNPLPPPPHLARLPVAGSLPPDRRLTELQHEDQRSKHIPPGAEEGGSITCGLGCGQRVPVRRPPGCSSRISTKLGMLSPPYDCKSRYALHNTSGAPSGVSRSTSYSPKQHRRGSRHSRKIESEVPRNPQVTTHNRKTACGTDLRHHVAHTAIERIGELKQTTLPSCAAQPQPNPAYFLAFATPSRSPSSSAFRFFPLVSSSSRTHLNLLP